jgi:2-polyprenyl-3-methyl-5-hydroxy-6-metoxy-1,4-benzoquinol methylase
VDLDSAIKNYVEFYTKINKIYGLSNQYFYNVFDSPKQVIKRLIYILDKILPIIKKHPQLFINKNLLDLGCGTGEHSYFLSHFCESVDCYDPAPSHKKLLNKLFSNSNSFRVLDGDYTYNQYDTVLISGVLECIDHYGDWIRDLSNNLNFNYMIVIFSPGINHTVHGDRNFRLYDDSDTQTKTDEEHLLKYTKHLTLFDRLTFDTRENRLDEVTNEYFDHTKVVHIYQKK